MSAGGGQTGVRRAWLDCCPGEARGLVTLDGRPEHLFVVREGDPTPRLGQRFEAKVNAVSGRLGLARLDIGDGPATLRLRGQAAPSVGERLAVEVVAEAARGKPPLVRRLRSGEAAAPTDASRLETRLAALGLETWGTGEEARERIDEAEAEALTRTHEVGQGVTLTVEPTRALVAVDVDLVETGAPISVVRANALAVAATARLLRLKALAGLVAIDLVGFVKDRAAITAAAREAFAPDGPEVSVGLPSRFGVLELAKPHGRQPLHEQLLEADGRPQLRTLAQTLVRALERQGRFEPGARLIGLCSPDLAVVVAPLVAQLGPRFSVRADLGGRRDAYDIRTE